MPQKLRNRLNDQNSIALILFFVSLVIFNVAFISSNGWARVAWSTLGYLSLLVTYQVAGLNLKSVGLSKKNAVSGLKYAGTVVFALLLVLLAVFFLNKKVFMDSRYHHSLSTALYSSLLLLPLKTVFFEELAFRGILPAIVLKIRSDRRYASIVSSLAFGLWHVFSAAKIGSYNFVGSFTIPGFFVIAGVFIATSFAGYLFCELRWRSGSLIAPVFVHWFINGAGIILASLSWS